MGNLTTGKSKKPSILLNWFELPVLDLARAVNFYSHLFQVEFEMMEQGDYSMSLFPSQIGGGGALMKGPGSVPSEYGALIYLNANDHIPLMLKRVEEAGGRIILEQTTINEEMGSFGLFIDTEGNRLALHSNQAI
jgi:predicted enzyme related to lactoylglutathione lyase